MRKQLTLLTLLLVSTMFTFAHDFEKDGFYYNFLGGDSVAVTYKGKSVYDNYDTYSGDIVIPATVSYNNVTYHVTSITDQAFYNSTNLTAITIPTSITSISDRGVFYSCYSLSTVTWNAKNCTSAAPFAYIVSQIKSFTFGDEVETIPASLCYGMPITKIMIPNSVQSIGDKAFAYCSRLSEITIPNSVKSIGEEAFRDCTGFKSVTIPENVTFIDVNAFYQCSNLTTVTWNAKNCSTTYTVFGNDYETGCPITSFTFGDQVESVPAYLCQYMEKLTSVTLPESVTTVGEWVFNGCSGLTAPVFNKHVFAKMPTTYTGTYAIPEGIKTIVVGAFRECTELTGVTIPNSVTSIGELTFVDCSSLQHLAIPESITSLGDGTFYGCTGLEDLILPATLQAIGRECFACCSQLQKMTCLASIPPTIERNTFYDVKREIPLYVPEKSMETYKAADYWKEFTNLQAAEDADGLVDILKNENRSIHKVVESGVLYIIRDNEKYTIDGRKVK